MATSETSTNPFADAFRPFVSLSGDKRSEVEQLLTRIEADEATEAEGMEVYKRAAEASRDAGVRFLMNLIMEDEERHSRLLQAMAHDIRHSLDWSQDKAEMPSIHPASNEAVELGHQADRFLAVEQENLKDLKGLRHAVKDLEEGMLDLIVGTMEDDTKKHIEILQFIRKRVSQARH